MAAAASRYFGAGPAAIVCWKCGEEGHRSFECTGNTVLAPRCFLCGEKGHISSSCPAARRLHQQPQGSSSVTWSGPSNSNGAICMSCGQLDHVNCSFLPTDLKIAKSCARCGASGHDDSRCPLFYREEEEDHTKSNGDNDEPYRVRSRPSSAAAAGGKRREKSREEEEDR
jgi:hypothetical protein